MLYCDGLDSPIGFAHERSSLDLWTARFENSTPFLSKRWKADDWQYQISATLHLKNRTSPSRYRQKVYAAGSGFVLAAFKSMVVIQHIWPSKRIIYTRYRHLGKLLVKTGDWVVRGMPIAAMRDRLTYDISTHPSIVRDNPLHKSNLTPGIVQAVYADPLLYTQAHRPIKDSLSVQTLRTLMPLMLYAMPSRQSALIGRAAMGELVYAYTREHRGGFDWRRVVLRSSQDNGWMTERQMRVGIVYMESVSLKADSPVA